MWHLRLIPEHTNFDFIGKRKAAFALSLLLFAIAVVSLAVRGLNLGIDFSGGILIDARYEKPIDMAQVRSALGKLSLGEVELQQFGTDRDLLIKVQQRRGETEASQGEAVKGVQNALGPGYEYRRVELVGPKVGGELLRDGLLATFLAIAAITAYVAFRFEWQFGVAAMIATFHDVAITMGLFSVVGLEFNLTAIAALLTLAGYSLNDTVVVFDRIRETLRKTKTGDMKAVINDSVNQMLSRTLMTSGTTLLAILPLLIFGGSTLRNFTTAMTFGIVLGTFSSIYVAAALLLYMKPLRGIKAQTAAK